MNRWQVLRSSAALELAHLQRDRAFAALTALAAVSFLVMVSLFGLTGAYAPVVVIDRDGGAYSARLVKALLAAHHSFSIRNMSEDQAKKALQRGRLVGIITIPAGFSEAMRNGSTAPVEIEIDNVNVDLTNDVQRALPAAIVDFGRRENFPGLRASMVEHDVLPRDTGYIPYLAVSALALDVMLIAGVLGALAISREWEQKTVKMIRLSPAPPGVILGGKLLVAGAVASVALLITVVAIGLIYGVTPVAPWVTLFTLLACIAIFTCFGAWIGAVLKRTLAAVPLLFGLIMPFYVDSGALEPTRFDGETIWRIAHLSPLYYAVGALEWAFHGIRVTPEPIYVDLLVLAAMAVAAVALTSAKLSRGAVR